MQLNVSRTGSKESMLGGNAEKVTNGNYDMQVNYPWWRQFTNEWNHIHTFIMILFLFPYICIPILFSLSGKSNNNSYYSVQVAYPFTTNSLSGIPSVGNQPFPVSLNQQGNLQFGGGTTLYKNSSFQQEFSPYYVDLDPIFDDLYLFGYYNKGTGNSTFSIISVDSDNQISTVSSTSNNYFFYQLATLNQKSGLFVFITQCYDYTTAPPFVIAGSVNLQSYEISLGSHVEYTNNYSLFPLIIRLTDTTFIIAYYNADPNFVYVRTGRVNPATLLITLYAPTPIVSNSAFGIFFTMTGLTESTFMLMYCNESSSQPGLTALSGSVDSGSYIISLGVSSTLLSTTPTFYLASTKIDNFTSVITYCESNSIRVGITAMVISLETVSTNPTEFAIRFGSNIMVNTGQVLATLPDYSVMGIKIATISSDFKSGYGSSTGSAQVAILYSNVNNGGAAQVTILDVLPTGSLVRASPDFILNDGNPNFNSIISWGALTAGRTNTLDAQLLMVNVLSETSGQGFTSLDFAVMEILPEPIGIAQPTVVSSSSVTASVVISGTISGFSNLIVGTPYYATTSGKLIAASSSFGRIPGGYDVTLTYVQSGNILVSLGSYVGIAISPTTILVQC